MLARRDRADIVIASIYVNPTQVGLRWTEQLPSNRIAKLLSCLFLLLLPFPAVHLANHHQALPSINLGCAVLKT